MCFLCLVLVLLSSICCLSGVALSLGKRELVALLCVLDVMCLVMLCLYLIVLCVNLPLLNSLFGLFTYLC